MHIFRYGWSRIPSQIAGSVMRFTDFIQTALYHVSYTLHKMLQVAKNNKLAWFERLTGIETLDGVQAVNKTTSCSA